MSSEEADPRVFYYRIHAALDGLDEDVRTCAAGAFQALREIATAMRSLNFPDVSVTLVDFERVTGMERLCEEGISLREDARHMLDSAVHNLPKVLEIFELYTDAVRGPPVEFRNDFARVPDVRPLFEQAQVPGEWSRFFRVLTAEFVKTDASMDELAVPDKLTLPQLAALCFHGYLLASSLYQALTALALAKTSLSWRSAGSVPDDIGAN